MIYEEISAIGAFTALSEADGDYFAIDPRACSGGDDAETRVTVEDAPGSDGVLIEPPLDGAQIITLVGDFVVVSVGLSAETGYKTAVQAVVDDLKSAVNDGKAAPIDLVHPGGTLKVWKYSKVDPTWPSFWVCRATFSVVVDVFA